MIVMGIGSMLSEMCVKNDSVECIAEKRTCGDGGKGVRVNREQ
jgi:hypothetical protein